MNEKLLDETKKLLSNLKSESFQEKDILIEDLCDLIDSNLISTQLKIDITESVIELFYCKNNYDIQESIFHFLSTASNQKILQNEIINIMLEFMSEPTSVYLEYAVDILVDSKLSISDRNRFKELVIKCLHSKDMNVRKATISILEYYQENGVSIL